MPKLEIESRFRANMRRVSNLVKIYEKRRRSRRQGRRPVGDADVLRAAVVLLHATLEDLLRSLLRDLLPSQSESVINSVPLVGMSGQGRAEKFLLGKLTPFRTITVGDVISKSVEEWLERSNYNDPGDLALAIENCGLNKQPVEGIFPTLNGLMSRRHMIVHRADRGRESGSGHHIASSIGTHHLRPWIAAVQTFADALLGQLP